MSDPPLHRMFHHYSEMPYSQRVLFTATLMTLALGYLFALTLIWLTYAGRAGGNPYMLSYQDLVVAYAGSDNASTLESALAGPMRTMLPSDQHRQIIGWLHSGATKAKYETTVKPIIAQRCLLCHNGSNPHIPNLSTWDGVKKVTAQNTGTPMDQLVRVSHIHMFGLTMIFFMMGWMFSHAYMRPVWLKCSVIALPYLCILGDISSWYLTKLYHPMALLVIGSGMVMAACFAFMWLVTMYQMWFSKPPRAVLDRSPDIPGLM